MVGFFFQAILLAASLSIAAGAHAETGAMDSSPAETLMISALALTTTRMMPDVPLSHAVSYWRRNIREANGTSISPFTIPPVPWSDVKRVISQRSFRWAERLAYVERGGFHEVSGKDFSEPLGPFAQRVLWIQAVARESDRSIPRIPDWRANTLYYPPSPRFRDYLRVLEILHAVNEKNRPIQQLSLFLVSIESLRNSAMAGGHLENVEVWERERELRDKLATLERSLDQDIEKALREVADFNKRYSLEGSAGLLYGRNSYRRPTNAEFRFGEWGLPGLEIKYTSLDIWTTTTRPREFESRSSRALSPPLCSAIFAVSAIRPW